VSCPGAEASGINEVPELALASKRVAWLEAVGGNNLDLTVKSFVLGSTRTVTVSTYAENGFGAGETPDGDWIWNLTGDGNLIVYDRWHACTAYPADVDASEYGPHCDQPALGDHQDYILSEQKLLRVIAGKSVEIASAPETQVDSFRSTSLAVVSVDAGRIAAQDASGKVTIYSAKGAVLEQIAVPSGTFAGTALQSSRLVTLRDGKLEIYNVSSGELVKTIPLASGSVLRDLHGGLAVSVRGRKVQVVRLSDGKKLTFSPPGKGAVDAQIEAAGLYYSYNLPSGRDHGRVVFVPFARVLKKLR
jgi:WD40 repeat protein